MDLDRVLRLSVRLRAGFSFLNVGVVALGF